MNRFYVHGPHDRYECISSQIPKYERFISSNYQHL